MPALTWRTRRSGDEFLVDTLGPCLSTALGMVFVACLLHSSLAHCHGELSSESCTRTLTAGLFSGITTSESKGAFLDAVSGDLSKVSNGRHTVKVFGDSVGYLLSDLKPVSPVLFSLHNRSAKKLSPFLEEYFAQPENKPDLILCIPQSESKETSEVEEHVVRKFKDHLLIKTGDCEIYAN